MTRWWLIITDGIRMTFTWLHVPFRWAVHSKSEPHVAHVNNWIIKHFAIFAIPGGMLLALTSHNGHVWSIRWWRLPLLSALIASGATVQTVDVVSKAVGTGLIVVVKGVLNSSRWMWKYEWGEIHSFLRRERERKQPGEKWTLCWISDTRNIWSKFVCGMWKQ